MRLGIDEEISEVIIRHNSNVYKPYHKEGQVNIKCSLNEHFMFFFQSNAEAHNRSKP